MPLELFANANILRGPADRLHLVRMALSTVLSIIRSLVTEGLFEVGNLSSSNGRFSAWDTTLDEPIERIRDVYTSKFDDEPAWWFYCWLDATEKGLLAAKAIEASRGSAQDS